jgi:hypothetical protein
VIVGKGHDRFGIQDVATPAENLRLKSKTGRYGFMYCFIVKQPPKKQAHRFDLPKEKSESLS